MTEPSPTPQPNPAPYMAAERPTNLMAILSLIGAFIAPPAGLVLGILAQRQIARTGEEGAGLAKAGAIIGGVFTAFDVSTILRADSQSRALFYAAALDPSKGWMTRAEVREAELLPPEAEEPKPPAPVVAMVAAGNGNGQTAAQ